MARIFINLLTATSLLLSLVVGWLWVRGYTWYDDLGVVTTSKTAAYRADRHYALGSQVGGLTWPTSDPSADQWNVRPTKENSTGFNGRVACGFGPS